MTVTTDNNIPVEVCHEISKYKELEIGFEKKSVNLNLPPVKKRVESPGHPIVSTNMKYQTLLFAELLIS